MSNTDNSLTGHATPDTGITGIVQPNHATRDNQLEIAAAEQALHSPQVAAVTSSTRRVKRAFLSPTGDRSQADVSIDESAQYFETMCKKLAKSKERKPYRLRKTPNCHAAIVKRLGACNRPRSWIILRYGSAQGHV